MNHRAVHNYAAAKRARFRRSYQVRCSRAVCQARRTLRQHPDDYVRPPTCDCGNKRWRIDWYRTSRIESQRFTCHCARLPFPHRAGSSIQGVHCIG